MDNILDGRSYSGEAYRYGFNGQESDDEVSGAKNSYTAEFWQYDPRIGRRWNIDPEFELMPGISPYATFANNPIVFDDPDGDCPLCLIEYLYQAGSNLISGDGIYDAFIGNIEWESVALSALPGGKYLYAASKLIDSKVDVTVNRGFEIKSNKEAFIDLVSGKITKKVTKKMGKFVKKMTSDKAMQKVNRRLNNYNNKIQKYEQKMKKGTLTDKQKQKFLDAKANRDALQANKGVMNSFRETFGKMSKNELDATKKIFEKNIKREVVKPLVTTIVDSLINTGGGDNRSARDTVKVKF